MLENGGETMIKYQIAHVRRALRSIIEICDAGHLDYWNHVVFVRHAGMIANLETERRSQFLGRSQILFSWTSG